MSFSSDIPQADVLEDAVKTIEGEKKGFHSYQVIAEHIDMGERQGRYYCA